MLASARRRALKATAVYGALPVFGRNVGRAISPAAGPCGITVRCGASTCRALKDISAASRQCTPQSAPSGASSSPCRGAFLGGRRSKSLPCKGRCRRRRRRGAAPCPANTLPGCCALPAAAPPAKRGGETLSGCRTSPTKHRARLCRALRGISIANRQCTPPSAPSGASSSPCRGAFLGGCPLKSLPCKGRCRRRRRRGAAPGPANILPGRRILPATIHPAKHGERPFPATALSRPPHAPA